MSLEIVPAPANEGVATTISSIIVGNFTHDPSYSTYNPATLRSYTETNSPDRMLANLQNPNSKTFIGLIDARIIGALSMRYYSSGYPDPDSDGAWRIRRLHIDPAYRRKGYASELLSHAENIVYGLGFMALYAEATPEASPLLVNNGWVGELVEKTVTYTGDDGRVRNVTVPRFLAKKLLD